MIGHTAVDGPVARAIADDHAAYSFGCAGSADPAWKCADVRITPFDMSGETLKDTTRCLLGRGRPMKRLVQDMPGPSDGNEACRTSFARER